MRFGTDKKIIHSKLISNLFHISECLLIRFIFQYIIGKVCSHMLYIKLCLSLRIILVQKLLKVALLRHNHNFICISIHLLSIAGQFPDWTTRIIYLFTCSNTRRCQCLQKIRRNIQISDFIRVFRKTVKCLCNQCFTVHTG